MTKYVVRRFYNERYFGEQVEEIHCEDLEDARNWAESERMFNKDSVVKIFKIVETEVE